MYLSPFQADQPCIRCVSVCSIRAASCGAELHNSQATALASFDPSLAKREHAATSRIAKFLKPNKVRMQCQRWCIADWKHDALRAKSAALASPFADEVFPCFTDLQSLYRGSFLLRGVHILRCFEEHRLARCHAGPDEVPTPQLVMFIMEKLPSNTTSAVT